MPLAWLRHLLAVYMIFQCCQSPDGQRVTGIEVVAACSSVGHDGMGLFSEFRGLPLANSTYNVPITRSD
jgi:hypothetical protein